MDQQKKIKYILILAIGLTLFPTIYGWINDPDMRMLYLIEGVFAVFGVIIISMMLTSIIKDDKISLIEEAQQRHYFWENSPIITKPIHCYICNDELRDYRTCFHDIEMVPYLLYNGTKHYDLEEGIKQQVCDRCYVLHIWPLLEKIKNLQAERKIGEGMELIFNQLSMQLWRVEAIKNMIRILKEESLQNRYIEALASEWAFGEEDFDPKKEGKG